MTSVMSKREGPLSFSFEPRRSRGIESPTDVSLTVHSWQGHRFAISFDRSAALDPSEVDALRRYLMDAPRAELDALFGSALEGRAELDEAQLASHSATGKELTSEGLARGLGKGALLVGLVSGGAVGAFYLLTGLVAMTSFGLEEANRAEKGAWLAGFVKGALDLSYYQRLFAAVIGRRDPAEEQARTKLSDSLEEARAKMVEIAKQQPV